MESLFLKLFRPKGSGNTDPCQLLPGDKVDLIQLFLHLSGQRRCKAGYDQDKGDHDRQGNDGRTFCQGQHHPANTHDGSHQANLKKHIHESLDLDNVIVGSCDQG